MVYHNTHWSCCCKNKKRTRNNQVLHIMKRHPDYPIFITGIHKKIVRLRILLYIFRAALSCFENPIAAYKGLRKLQAIRMTTHDVKFLPKFVKSGSKYFLTHNLPAWPSSAFRKFLENEFNRIRFPDQDQLALHSIIFSITARCSLKCEHCYEWENISSKEILSKEDLLSILGKIQDYGISHIQFSGGEPIARLDDLIALLEFKSKDIDCWILTSGFELSPEIALKLKNAGLVGVIISLDHWDETLHNKFRKNDKSFYWVKEAAKNCKDAGLITALSLCATKEFISTYNLKKYNELAGEWGISFLRILEPRAVGGYDGKAVLLSREEKAVLEDFFIQANTNTAKNFNPSVMYPGYYQKHTGCFGAGNRYIYVDSRGEVHACPFCQGSVGNMLSDNMDSMIKDLRKKGCHMFKSI